MQSFREFSHNTLTEAVEYAHVTVDNGQKFFIRVTGNKPDSLSGYEVNKEGEEIAPKGHDRRLRVIQRSAIKKLVPMKMDRTYGWLVKT